MSTSAIVAEMILAAVKKGAELTENTTDDQLVVFVAWFLNLDIVRAWLDGTPDAPQPFIAVPEGMSFSAEQAAKWLPMIVQLIGLFRSLLGK